MGKVSIITDGLENMGPLRTGGQGSVYKGRRIAPQFSAVKLLPTPICAENDDDKNFRDFKNEVIKLKKVNEEPNPYVVKILNSGLTDSGGFPFIEMEYINGPDLEELIKSPHDPVFTISEVIKVADQLGNALAHCHKSGIMHGDIKSNNVKLNIDSGNYMLLDFGLAIMSDEQRRTSLRYAGAIEFMAPEQSEGIMRFESDVYSFGIILYELLAGRVPFPLMGNGETARNTVMVSHLEEPVPDILALRTQNLPESWPDEKKQQEMQVPIWLLNVIAKCLEKKPEDRYSSSTELYEAIIMHSTLSEKSAVADASLLQRENERLHTLLMNHKRKQSYRDQELAALAGQITALDSEITTVRDYSAGYQSKSVISIPKTAFLALTLLLLSLTAFTGYSLYNKEEDIEDINITGASQRDSLLTPEKPEATFQQASLAETTESKVSEEVEKQTVVPPVKKAAQVSDNTPEKKKGWFRRKRGKEDKKDEKENTTRGKFIEIKFIKK